MRKKFLTALLVLASFASLTGCTTTMPAKPQSPQVSPSPVTTAPQHQPITLAKLHMFSEQVGWALGGGEILRTLDGGEHWVIVTPPGYPSGPRGHAMEFLDATTAWAAAWNEEGTKIVVFRTANGGQTWQSAGVPLEFKGGANYPTALSFVDAQRGWLMVEPDHGMNSSPGRLFATTDGGKSWTEIAGTDGSRNGLPFGGTIRFCNTSEGWVVGSPVSTVNRRLFMTGDGGLTWGEQRPSLPTGLPPGSLDIDTPPTFFPPQRTDGVLLTVFVPESHRTDEFRTVIYNTHDGGKTWGDPWVSKGRPEFLSANDAWMWVEEPGSGSTASAHVKLVQTRDGGTTWSDIATEASLPKALQAGLHPAQLDFVTDQTGWAIFQLPNGRISQLLKTTDGGSTWVLLEEEGKAPKHAVALQPQDFGLQGITLGDSPEFVKKILGEPAEVSVMHGLGLPLWLYKKQGIEVGFTSRQSNPGEVIWIRTTEKFSGTTTLGVGIGTPAEQVEGAYGAASVTVDKKSIEFVMAGGKVTMILIKTAL